MGTRRTILLCLWIAGCQATPAARDAGPPPAVLPPDVNAILEARCQPCHSAPPRRYAPNPLVSWEDTQAPSPGEAATPVYEMIARRVASSGFPMPPRESPEAAETLDAERQVLIDWADAGAPPAAPAP